MPKSFLASAATAILAFAALPVAAQAPVRPAPPSSSDAQTPSARLARLFTASDEADLKRNPLTALVRGDMRYADQFGDGLSDAWIAAEKAALTADLAALSAIDRAALAADEQVGYDAFRWQLETDLQGFSEPVLAASIVRPIDHFNGMHQDIPNYFSGNSLAPFRTVKDYEDNLKRLDGFVTAMDRALERMQQGVAAGVVQPRLISERVLAQLDRHVAGGVDAMPLMLPVKTFPPGISAADQTRLRAAYARMIGERVLASYTRMRDYVRDVYLPASRGDDRPGLGAMPGGPQLYRYLILSQTTTRMTPDEIHDLGLAEVARIRGEMGQVMKAVGFKGDLPAFFTYMKTDLRFKPASAQALVQGYQAIGKRVDAALPRLFRTMPRTALEIRPYPDFLAKDSAAASYMPGTPDGSRAGIFYFNTHDLSSRSTAGMETLYLHEGAPGHHFQISLANENKKLPAFQRFGGNTAYIEGWALYAESLGRELGLFTDPYAHYGRLDDEMLRAMRLVVDTGLHAKGWSRQQAVNYMRANSSQGDTDVKNEVDRYVAMPGQALTYKMGDLRIRAARTRAEKALGAGFDIRAFHEQVLMSGALPLEVLDAKIDRWIKGGGK